jgi:hypothetical protein
VPGYVRGVAAMDLKTRTVRWLRPASGIALSGIDGFYRYGDAFLAVQNGVSPKRVVLFSSGFDEAGDSGGEHSRPGRTKARHAGGRRLLLHRQHRLECVRRRKEEVADPQDRAWQAVENPP